MTNATKEITIEDFLKYISTNSGKLLLNYNGYTVTGATTFEYKRWVEGNLEYTSSCISFEKNDNFEVFTRSRKIKNLELSKKLKDMIGVEEISEEIQENLRKKYSIKEEFGTIWISNRGNLFFEKKRINKVGKFIKLLNPELGSWEIDNIVDEINVMKLNFKDTKVTSDVTGIYNTKRLKISSCMSKKGFSFKLLEDLDIKVMYLESNGNIIARCLLHEDKYIDRIYATSTYLNSSWEEYLINKGYKYIPNRYKTKSIKVSDDTFYPYMDNVKYLNKEEGGFISLQNFNEVYTLSSTDGRLYTNIEH